MGLHKDPMLDKAIAMAFNSGDFAAAWRACGKPGTWRNADRQWKASMKKQQEQQTLRTIMIHPLNFSMITLPMQIVWPTAMF